MPSYRDLDGTVNGRLTYAGYSEEKQQFLTEHNIDDLSVWFMQQAQYNDADHSLETHIATSMLTVHDEGQWTGCCEMMQAVCQFSAERDDLDEDDRKLIDEILDYLYKRRCELLPERYNHDDGDTE